MREMKRYLDQNMNMTIDITSTNTGWRVRLWKKVTEDSRVLVSERETFKLRVAVKNAIAAAK